MFIKNSCGGYNRSGELVASGLFLMLVMPRDQNGRCTSENVRAIVRHVRMVQCGHWMMGSVHILGERYTVSGSYGADGLPMDVSQAVYDAAIPLPGALYDAWNIGGGHNSAGSEVPDMRRWANANLNRLYVVRRPSGSNKRYGYAY